MRRFLTSALYLALFGLVMLTAACRKTDPSIAELSGTYTGTFQRQQGGNGQISQVSLVFSGNTWQGNSQTAKYPALCKGTYTINSDNRITFVNSCAWTAEFDWSLVLSGDYAVKVTGNEVEISRDGGGYRDVYKLSR